MSFTFSNNSFKGSSFQEKLQNLENAELIKSALLNADLGLTAEQFSLEKNTVTISPVTGTISSFTFGSEETPITVTNTDTLVMDNASATGVIAALEKAKFSNIVDAITEGGMGAIHINASLIKTNQVEFKLSESQNEKILQQAQSEEKIDRVKNAFVKSDFSAEYDAESNSFYSPVPQEHAKQIQASLIAECKAAGLTCEDAFQFSPPSRSKVMLTIDLNKVSFNVAPTLSEPSVAERADAKKQLPGGTRK
jgi:hypothetical protein